MRGIDPDPMRGTACREAPATALAANFDGQQGAIDIGRKQRLAGPPVNRDRNRLPLDHQPVVVGHVHMVGGGRTGYVDHPGAAGRRRAVQLAIDLAGAGLVDPRQDDRDRCKLPRQRRAHSGARETIGKLFGDEPRGQPSFAKARVLHQRREEIDVVANALQLEPVERGHLKIGRFVARRPISDELGDHRIVEHRDLAALDHAIIHADPIAARRRPIAHETAGRRQETAIGIFGIDPVFDRPAGEPDILLRKGEPLARRHPDHLLDEIDSRHAFRHRMLDLEARVHFQEIEAAVCAHDQLDRAGRIIAHSACQGDRLFTHRAAHLGRDEWRWRFFDHLLVPALDRTFAFAQIEDGAMLVAQHLDLDMARLLDEFFDEHPIIAKARQPLAAHAVEILAHVAFRPGKTHALAPATRRRLHHHRIADVAGDRDGMFGRFNFADETGDDAHPGSGCQLFRFDLVAHRCDRPRRRADEDDAGLGTGAGEAFAFRQEAITRVDAIGPGFPRGLQDEIGAQIAFGGRRRTEPHGFVGHLHMRRLRVGIGIDRNRLQPHFPRGAHHPARDLATVGDQYLFQHSTPLGRGRRLHRSAHSAASTCGGMLWPSSRSTSAAATTRLVPGPKIACTPASRSAS